MSKSILSNERVCYVCKTTFYLHQHHIFYGTANRQQSEKYGCWCYLCIKHHTTARTGVHFNKQLDTELKQRCQRAFEEIHGHEKFMKVFGKNYL